MELTRPSYPCKKPFLYPFLGGELTQAQRSVIMALVAAAVVVVVTIKLMVLMMLRILDDVGDAVVDVG